MNFYTNRKRKILEVKLSAVVLAKEQIFDFSAHIFLRLKSQQPAVNEVKGQMYHPIFKKLAQIYLIVLHLFRYLFAWRKISDLQKWL